MLILQTNELNYTCKCFVGADTCEPRRRPPRRSSTTLSNVSSAHRLPLGVNNLPRVVSSAHRLRSRKSTMHRTSTARPRHALTTHNRPLTLAFWPLTARLTPSHALTTQNATLSGWPPWRAVRSPSTQAAPRRPWTTNDVAPLLADRSTWRCVANTSIGGQRSKGQGSVRSRDVSPETKILVSVSRRNVWVGLVSRPEFWPRFPRGGHNFGLGHSFCLGHSISLGHSLEGLVSLSITGHA